jgi:hypothetical protein
MLRFVSETSATVWAETDQRCTVEILGRSATTFCVAGHHYALVVIDDLPRASSLEYDVRVDGETRWPLPGSTLPPSRIRTVGSASPRRIIYGSCRSAAPHEPPWSLQLELDPRGRGVDALYTYALSMLDRPPEEWPDLAVFLGDQIYADESSPKTRERVAEVRAGVAERDPDSVPPPEIVGGFEQYTWLYQESWSKEMERWFFSNVPSVMVFDDHETIDDWNISSAWETEINKKPWWKDHVIGGLMTYWIYQHLGNLSPEVIKAEGLLESLLGVSDGEQRLREWALRWDELTSSPDHYRFSFVRDIGRVRLVMIDSRNARVLEPRKRRMIDAEEWDWITDVCRAADIDHLLIGTSLPLFVPIGLHDLQVWSERICDGAWGRVGRKFGEWLRVKADMEDWAAFNRSFDELAALLGDIASASEGGHGPATISVLSGDIHFSFAAEIQYPASGPSASRVHQLVSSPIRNALLGPERMAMRLGTSVVARSVGRVLRRLVGRRRPQMSWQIDLGPVFANSLGQLSFDGRAATLLVLQARPHTDNVLPAFDEVIEFDLVAGARAHAGISVRTPRRASDSTR